MTGRIAASDFYYMLPKNEWFKVYKEVDRLIPGLDKMNRKHQISQVLVYLNRRAKWGDVKKRGVRGHMEFMVIA